MTTWGSGGITWGTGSSWGSGVSTSPPSIISVSTPHSPWASAGVVARRGGDVITIVGEHFADPMTIEILDGSSVVVGECYIPLAEFSISEDRVYAATPALPDGTYGIRVTTDAGSSAILTNALTYQLFSEEMKAELVRKNISHKWEAGRRLLIMSEEI